MPKDYRCVRGDENPASPRHDLNNLVLCEEHYAEAKAEIVKIGRDATAYIRTWLKEYAIYRPKGTPFVLARGTVKLAPGQPDVFRITLDSGAGQAKMGEMLKVRGLDGQPVEVLVQAVYSTVSAATVATGLMPEPL